MVSILTSCTEKRWWLQGRVRAGHACDLLTSSATMIPIITTRLIWSEIRVQYLESSMMTRQVTDDWCWMLIVPDVDMETLLVFAAP